MKKEDFTFIRKDCSNEHEDFWYETNKETNEYLMRKYAEQCLRGIFRVVYSKDEDVVGIERTFPFNYDVILSEDEELHDILKSLSE